MRPTVVLAVAALVAFLSGCTVPDEDPEADPLFGLCPQWTQGPGSHAMDVSFGADGDATREVELASANGTHDGRPLDLYRVVIDSLQVDGRLELRAFAADGRQLGIRDHRVEGTQQIVPVLAFTDGSAAGHEFDVFLAPVSHDGEASPAPVTLRWTQAEGNATVQATATFHYKVCGAEF